MLFEGSNACRLRKRAVGTAKTAVVMVLCSASVASAQGSDQFEGRRLEFVPAVHVGFPHILGVTFGIGYFPNDPDRTGEGFFGVLEPSVGDIKVAVGYNHIVEDAGLRATILRTHLVGWPVPAERWYLGAEIHKATRRLMFRLGAFRRMDDGKSWMIGGGVGLGSL